MANLETVSHSSGRMEKERGLGSLDPTLHVEDGEVSGSIVYPFDNSVENHYMMIDTISKLCGETTCDAFEEGEIDRFSSNITFLSDWRHFNYQPRNVRFASDTVNNQEKCNMIVLTQFSAAAVPQPDKESTQMTSPESRKDFLLYVGGLIWAVDWCPRSESVEGNTYCEFIAVSAHPPDSSYHKIGAPLSGRGMVQIWCLVCHSQDLEIDPDCTRALKRKYQINSSAKEEEAKPKRPRGRPRKDENVSQPKSSEATMNPIPDVGDACERQFVEALAIQLPNCSLSGLSSEENVTQPPIPDEGFSGTGVEPIATSMKKMDGAASREARPRGRPRKNKGETQLKASNATKSPTHVAGEASENHFVEALGIQLPDSSLNSHPTEENMLHTSVPNESFPVTDVEPVTSSKPNTINGVKEEEAKSRKPRERPRKNDEETRPKKLVAKKNQIHVGDDCDIQVVEAPAAQLPDCSVNSIPASGNVMEPPAPSEECSVNDTEPIISWFKKKLKVKVSSRKGTKNAFSTGDESAERTVVCQEREGFRQNDKKSDWNITNDCCSKLPFATDASLKDAMIPRVVMCMGHDGKVAWDVKWNPKASESGRGQRMGYLAVVLGNGSIEVWEIPSLRMTRAVFSSQHKNGIDPRFLKLKPVFRCSKLKCGDRQSMPLIMEWSASPPHDILLAGCHDGLVALWKFSPTGSSEETQPLLCFSADTVPIRTLAWAPSEGDPESSNVVVTAGHEGLKFWDLRDPFRPLWDLIPVPRLIYSLDWLPDPRCVITSYDDGTLRFLSLAKASCDVPATGKPFSGTHQQGLHSLYCSPFAIWSVHVSRLTGMVAYCGADGNALHFQLTAKAVDMDPHRHRAPHFLCGSLTEEGSTIIVKTPSSEDPYPMKSSANEWSNAPRSIRGYIYKSNQVKRMKNEESLPKSDDGVLALCYDDEPGSQDIAPIVNKCKAGNRKEPTNGQACSSPDKDAQSNTGEADGKRRTGDDKIEVLPSKVVAMHRVRWNLNKGSEHWLCYGGAAGILRCQEVFALDMRKKL
ncbi:hypothetical protein Drorol1_Dr00014952 [Drosera rotundifolia]